MIAEDIRSELGKRNRKKEMNQKKKIDAVTASEDRADRPTAHLSSLQA